MDFRHKLIIPVANLITGMCGVYLSMYSISLLHIAGKFSLSSVMMGAIVAIQFAGICIPPLFLGTLCEKIGKRGVIMISLPLMVLGTFLVSVTSGIAMFIAGVIIIGAGFSVTEGTVTATLATEFSGKSTFHMGVAQASFSLGAVLSPLACEALFAAGYQYNDLFGIISAIFAVIFVLFFLTKPKNDFKGACDAGVRNAVKFFRQRVFVYISIAMVVYVGVEQVIASFADGWFELTMGMPQLSALALSLFWAGMIPTRLFLGAIKLRHSTTMKICAAGILLCIAAAVFISLPTMKLIAYAGLGVFCGPCWPLIVDVMAKKYPQNAGTVTNLMVSVGGLGGFAMPIIAGATVSGTDYTPVFIVAAAGAAIMGAMFYLTGRRSKA